MKVKRQNLVTQIDKNMFVANHQWPQSFSRPFWSYTLIKYLSTYVGPFRPKAIVDNGVFRMPNT